MSKRSPAAQRATLLPILACSLVLTACSGSSLGTIPAPVFTNTPGTAATQGATYTYQIQSQPSTGVTFTLASAPVGAALAGNTVTWTPTAAESRVPNPFAVTATTSGGNTTMFWSVTPTGTVSGSKIDTYWTPGGPVITPFDWTKGIPPLLPAFIPEALVPQPDGSFVTIQGSGNSDGTFSVPQVPSGYYWLQIAGLLGSSTYWTSSSTIDLGQEFDSQPGALPPLEPGTTTVQVDYSGLDPLQSGDDLTFLWGPLSFLSATSLPTGATTFTQGPITESFSLISSQPPSPAFLLQYEPENLGSLNTLRLGPAETIPSVTLQSVTANTVIGTLTPSLQKSFPLSVEGSAWPPLFSDAAPGSASVIQAGLTLSVLPFVTDGSMAQGVALPLLAEAPVNSFSGPQLSPLGPECPQSGQDPLGVIAEGSPVTTDQDFGMATYGDPFSSDWPRVFSVCQDAAVSLPYPGSSFSFSFFFGDTQSTVIPTSQVMPLIGHVQNPTLNSASLFQQQAIATTGATLNWAAPVGTPPTGYRIGAYIVTASDNGLSEALGEAGAFYTAKTSAVLPPLESGKNYVFTITAILDGAANFETKPNRSALPTASVSVVSAVITTQ